MQRLSCEPVTFGRQSGMGVGEMQRCITSRYTKTSRKYTSMQHCSTMASRGLAVAYPKNGRLSIHRPPFNSPFSHIHMIKSISYIYSLEDDNSRRDSKKQGLCLSTAYQNEAGLWKTTGCISPHGFVGRSNRISFASHRDFICNSASIHL